MRKKSQTTFFIIIGIVLVVSIIAVYISTNRPIKNENVIDVSNGINNCLYVTGENAIENIGLSGGYSFNPLFSNENPYYLEENKINVPSKEKIENEISSYVNEYLSACTKEFFKIENYSISEGIPKALTKIEKEKVIIELNYPLSVIKNKNRYLINDFYVEIPVRLLLVHELAKNISIEKSKTPDDICISCLNELADKNSLNIELEIVNKRTLMFILTDKKSYIKNTNFKFIFFNQYEI